MYESRYGNTKRVAETIVEGMRDAGGIEASLCNVKDVDLDTIVNYDAILLGGPNHVGGPTRSIKKFIDKLSSLPLAGKQFAVFDTYMGNDVEKAVRKMEQRIREKAPALKMLARGLSIQVQGMKGPIVDAELPKCKEFGTAIAATLMAPS
ncbi:MAG: flavodoxin domain-containing protein [Halobacteriota archaeon]